MRIESILACLTLLSASGYAALMEGGSSTAMAEQTDASHAVGAEGARELISLGDSLAPLQARFNSDRDRPRLVVLVSPT